MSDKRQGAESKPHKGALACTQWSLKSVMRIFCVVCSGSDTSGVPASSAWRQGGGGGGATEG